MNVTRMAMLSCAVALTSCALFNKDSSPKAPEITDTKIITKTEYLPGKTVVVGVEPPDDSVTRDCGRLTGEFIPDGPDIAGDDAVRTAAAWGRTANECRDQNLIMKGWILGVTSAQKKGSPTEAEKPVIDEAPAPVIETD